MQLLCVVRFLSRGCRFSHILRAAPSPVLTTYQQVELASLLIFSTMGCGFMRSQVNFCADLIGIYCCRERRPSYHLRNRSRLPDDSTLFRKVPPSQGYVRRLCRLMMYELHRQVALLKKHLKLLFSSRRSGSRAGYVRALRHASKVTWLLRSVNFLILPKTKD